MCVSNFYNISAVVPAREWVQLLLDRAESLQDSCDTIKGNRFDVNLMDANNLSLSEKKSFYEQFKRFTFEEVPILPHQYPEFFRYVVENP